MTCLYIDNSSGMLLFSVTMQCWNIGKEIFFIHAINLLIFANEQDTLSSMLEVLFFWNSLLVVLMEALLKTPIVLDVKI